MAKEMIVKMNTDYAKIKGCEYVRDLVRCENCKWFGKAGCAINIVDDSDRPKETDYCSFGERADT